MARATSLSPQLQFEVQSVQFGLMYDFYIENLNIIPTNTLITSVYSQFDRSLLVFLPMEEYT